jgi:hypothetical protein
VKARLVYYAFDLLYLDGFDLRAASLIERKRVLAELLNTPGLGVIRYCEHIEGDGPTVLEHASSAWRALSRGALHRRIVQDRVRPGSSQNAAPGRKRSRIALS